MVGVDLSFTKNKEGCIEEGIKLINEALEMLKPWKQDSNHPQIASSYYALSVAYMNAGNYDLAYENAEKAYLERYNVDEEIKNHICICDSLLQMIELIDKPKFHDKSDETRELLQKRINEELSMEDEENPENLRQYEILKKRRKEIEEKCKQISLYEPSSFTIQPTPHSPKKSSIFSKSSP